jgi:hypothetical protein
VTVFIAELETGERRQLKVTLPSTKPITEAEKDATIAWFQKRCALLDNLLGECLRRHYYNEAAVSQTWLDEARKAVTPGNLEVAYGRKLGEPFLG